MLITSLSRWKTLRRPAHIKLFPLQGMSWCGSFGLYGAVCRALSFTAVFINTCFGKHAGLQRKAVGWVSFPVGNLSSHRQTLLSKVRVPKNLLERHSCRGIKLVQWCWQCPILKWQRAKGRSQLFHNFCLRRENVAGVHINSLYALLVA